MVDKGCPRVLISYSQDSTEYSGRVREFSDKLRSEGIDAVIDQYVDSPPEGWPRWMERQIRECDFVLVVCTEGYSAKIRGEQPGEGYGAKWEGLLITQEIYESEGKNSKFIPLIFDKSDKSSIPTFLKGVTRYNVSDTKGYEDLYRRLTGQPKVIPAPLGPRQLLPPESVIREPEPLCRAGVMLSIVESSRAPDAYLFREFLTHIRTFIIKDQIPESGGWAISQERIFEYTTEKAQRDMDRREGGIISTYIALRALAAAGVDLSLRMEPGKSAAKYLLSRQANTGMFGRFYFSRTGEEISSSFRHTALSCLSLMILDGPPKQVIKGLECLSRMKIEDASGDTAPSIAMSTALVVLDSAANGEWGRNHLSTTQRKAMGQALTTFESEFIQAIESESKTLSSKYVPFWKPYGDGKNTRMLYDSALTTLDFLTLYPRPPWSAILSTLQHLTECRVRRGIPYDPESTDPDVGMSGYFAVICFRPNVRDQIEAHGMSGVLDAAQECLNFAMVNLNEEAFTRRTYCDTLANALLLTLAR